MTRDSRFAADQRRHFARADVAHFRWVTAGPGFAETEDRLLAPFVATVESPCLEVGCGEGANLLRLARGAQVVGVDRFPAKLVFAADAVPAARLAAADAAHLPFRAGTFRTVFVRDVLHHVDAPVDVLTEAVRVLARGGRLLVLEPNGRNPLIVLQTWLVRAERGARRSGAAPLRDLLERLPLANVDVRMLEPLPIRRLVLHYRFGAPRLGRSALARAALALSEATLGRMLPRSRWSYVALSAERI